MLTTTCALLLACAAFVAADCVSSRRSLEADLATLATVIGANSAAALTHPASDIAAAEHTGSGGRNQKSESRNQKPELSPLFFAADF